MMSPPLVPPVEGGGGGGGVPVGISFMRVSLHLVREVADHRDAEALSADALDDAHDADDEEADPHHALDQADAAAERRKNAAQREAEDHEHDPADDLGTEDGQAVLGVP